MTKFLQAFEGQPCPTPLQQSGTPSSVLGHWFSQCLGQPLECVCSWIKGGHMELIVGFVVVPLLFYSSYPLWRGELGNIEVWGVEYGFYSPPLQRYSLFLAFVILLLLLMLMLFQSQQKCHVLPLFVPPLLCLYSNTLIKQALFYVGLEFLLILLLLHWAFCYSGWIYMSPCLLWANGPLSMQCSHAGCEGCCDEQ